MSIFHLMQNLVPSHNLPYTICILSNRLAKHRKKADRIVLDAQERAFWRVHYPPVSNCTTHLQWRRNRVGHVGQWPTHFFNCVGLATHFWHYFLLFLFCLSPLIIDFFLDWPTHFQNRSTAAAAHLKGWTDHTGHNTVKPRPDAHMGMIHPEALLKGIGLTPQQQTL